MKNKLEQKFFIQTQKCVMVLGCVWLSDSGKEKVRFCFCWILSMLEIPTTMAHHCYEFVNKSEQLKKIKWKFVWMPARDFW